MADTEELFGRSMSGAVTDEEELEAAYRALDDPAAAALARRAVEAVERREVVAAGAAELLARLSSFVPDALVGLHGRLLDVDLLSIVLYPHVLKLGVMFRSADAETRERLRALAADSGRRLGSHALASLAWIDDDEVPVAFRQLIEHPPPWVSHSYSVAMYPLEAGWALRRDGTRQHLHLSSHCHRLERGAEAGSPVKVISRLHQRCGGCSGPLTELLDLDLRDERLGFLGLPGERLRVLTCEGCVCYGTVYAEVDLAGNARWLEDRADPPEGLYMSEDSYLPERQLGLGLKRRTPFEAHAFANNLSQLGGQSGWIQNPDYPECPRCGALMPFLGQVDLEEFPRCEGSIYAFLHVGCGVVATLFQQT